MKRLEKQQELQTDNLWVAQKILAEPDRYKAGSLMQVWAEQIVKQSEDATAK